MNRRQALTVLAMIQDRNTYFKSLDMTSQLTQLKSLKSMMSTTSTVFTAQREGQIVDLIRKRELTLLMSLDVLHALESDSWLSLLEGWNSMVDPELQIASEPLVAKVLTPVV